MIARDLARLRRLATHNVAPPVVKGHDYGRRGRVPQRPRIGLVLAWALSWVGLLALFAGCQQQPVSISRAPDITDGPLLGPPPTDLSALVDPAPVFEAPSRYGNPESYEVFGKTYVPLKSAQGYRATGVASWYGAKFHGRLTSTRERYDMFKLSAAHPTLPIPSYVHVTNLENGRDITVRVNDRGPFHAGRIVDLSYAAAVKLGFAEAGTARVRVEAATVANNFANDFYVQVGAFRDATRAERLRQSLADLGEAPVRVRQGDDQLHRVQVGPVTDRTRVDALQTLIDARYGPSIVLQQQD